MNEEDLGATFDTGARSRPRWPERRKPARAEMIETVAEVDEELMELFLAETGADRSSSSRRASARHPGRRTGAGLLRIGPEEQGRAEAARRDRRIICPRPWTGRPSRARARTGTGVETRAPDDDEPFSALAFKILADPFAGRLAFLRVYSGKLEAGKTVLNVNTGKRERIQRLLRMHADKREDLKEVRTGDIVAAVGFKEIRTGDTLTRPGDTRCCWRT